MQFWPDWVPVVLTVGVFLVGQFLEGNVLQPKLVGDAVRLHPVWLMFALLAFGSLFGFLGLLWRCRSRRPSASSPASR